MPSVILGQDPKSGAQAIISGNPWSGFVEPVGGIQLRWVVGVSGANAYIYLSGINIHPDSGGPTINSGGFGLSGLGMRDGMPLTPMDAYFIPKLAFKNSGVFNIGALHDPAGSGIGRLYFEAY